jgi:tetratricopeptide (TPR) repeat protein
VTGARRLALAACVLLAAPARAADAPAAVAEARRCWSTVGEPGVAACRRALEGGLTPSRASRVELTLASRLAGLGRWDEAADVHRQAIARRPRDGEPHRRLGATLLHGLGRPSDAEASLREAIRLGAVEARTWGDLALALVALGRLPEAVEAFDEALRLDAKFLEGRARPKAPRARAVPGHRLLRPLRPRPSPSRSRPAAARARSGCAAAPRAWT